MGLTAGSGLSTDPDPRRAAAEAARSAARGLRGAPADLTVVFASGAHLGAPHETTATIDAELAPAVLVGCGAGGVLGTAREAESGTAVAVWAAALDGGTAAPFHATVTEHDGAGVLHGMPELGSSSGLIVLADPFSFPAEPVLDSLARDAPGVSVLGGLASGRTPAGDGALFLDGEVHESGAVGVCLRDVEMLPCVSQGAAPLGREMTVTAAEGNVILELAGRPAVTAIEDVVGELPAAERGLVAAGLLIGIVIGGGKPDYEQGDFLVRGVTGVDAAAGAITVGANVEVGQVVRLHARDARSADLDLRRQLGLRADATGTDRPAGALVFSCNGRGEGMFGAGDHDAAIVDDMLDGAPAAGFFAAGEIGPVGGRSFVHTFTATVAVFPG